MDRPYGTSDWRMTISKLSTSKDHFFCPKSPVLTQNEFNLTVLIKNSFPKPKQQWMSQALASASTQIMTFELVWINRTIFLEISDCASCHFGVNFEFFEDVRTIFERFGQIFDKLFEMKAFVPPAQIYNEIQLLHWDAFSRWTLSWFNSSFFEIEVFPIFLFKCSFYQLKYHICLVYH